MLTPVVRVYDPATTQQVDALFDDLPMGISLSPLLSSIAFTPDGNLLLSDQFGGKIYHADITTTPGTEIVTELVSEIDIDGMPGADPFNPSGLVVDEATGEIYVVNLSGNNVLRFDLDGANPAILATIRPGDEADINSLYGTRTHNPTDIAFDRDGNLLVSVLGDTNPFPGGMPQPAEGGILRFDTSGNLLQTVAEGLLPVSGIALIDDLLPADYDGNGTVETADYEMWKSQFGDTVAAYAGADGNGDGVVDLADYTVWRNTLGATGIAASSGHRSAQVPEPATLFWTLGVLVCFARRIVRRRACRHVLAEIG
jgi:hypothetical protein